MATAIGGPNALAAALTPRGIKPHRWGIHPSLLDSRVANLYASAQCLYLPFQDADPVNNAWGGGLGGELTLSNGVFSPSRGNMALSKTAAANDGATIAPSIWGKTDEYCKATLVVYRETDYSGWPWGKVIISEAKESISTRGYAWSSDPAHTGWAIYSDTWNVGYGLFDPDNAPNTSFPSYLDAPWSTILFYWNSDETLAQIWINGILEYNDAASYGSYSLRSSGSASVTVIPAGIGGEIAFLATWSEQRMSPGQRQLLSSDPFILVRPDPTKVLPSYVPSSSATSFFPSADLGALAAARTPPKVKPPVWDWSPDLTAVPHLARRLRSAVILNEAGVPFDFAAKKLTTLVNSPTMEAGPVGLQLNHGTDTTNRYILVGTTAEAQLTPSYPGLFWYGTRSLNADFESLQQCDYDTGPSIYYSWLQRASTTLAVAWQWNQGGTRYFFNSANNVLPVDTPGTCALSIREGDQKGYVNGVQEGSATNTGAVTYNTSKDYRIGSSQSFPLHENQGTTICCYLFEDGLSAEEVRLLHRDPFIVYRPDPAKVIPVFIAAAGGGGRTGTLAVTEAADTLAAAGDVLITGTLNITEALDTLSAAGDIDISGTLSVTEALDVLAANGVVAISGTLSVTEANDTLVAYESAEVTATYYVTHPLLRELIRPVAIDPTNSVELLNRRF